MILGKFAISIFSTSIFWKCVYNLFYFFFKHLVEFANEVKSIPKLSFQEGFNDELNFITKYRASHVNPFLLEWALCFFKEFIHFTYVVECTGIKLVTYTLIILLGPWLCSATPDIDHLCLCFSSSVQKFINFVIV